ncbi:hypothetical protein HY251_20190 [bacterium]|nr:hypothetical protein [bacterium]
MRRRRLALALAGTLGLLAALLLAGAAVLELSPRDYRLVWMLQKTRRIEYSNPWRGSRVIEITEPSDVAAVVSAMTCKLDRRPGGRMRQLPWQLHFLLEDGREVVAAIGGSGEKDSMLSLVRLPGDRAWQAYRILKEIGEALPPAPFEPASSRVKVGTIQVEGCEGGVELDSSIDYEKDHLALVCELVTRWPSGVVPPSVEHATGKVVGRRGSIPLDGSRTVCGPGQFGFRRVMTMGLDEVESVELDVQGVKTTMKMPPVRFHDVIVAPCPGCGSEETVLPLFFNDLPKDAPLFHGRFKVGTGPEEMDGPKFFCEKCHASF